MIGFRDLTLRYRGGATVLDHFCLDVPRAKILTVLGPSGCGKTTLLRCAGGLVSARTPKVEWEGEVSGRCPEATSMIFQDLGLLPWKTVEQNIGLPLRWRRTPNWRHRVEALLAEFDLEAHARSWPAQLSGGLAQRTAIARALALQPDLLLMDEPFSALDAITREKAQQTLWDLWTARGPTVVLVTHSVDEAAALGHHVAVMTGTTPGRLAGLFDLGWNEGPAERRKSPRFFQQTTFLRSALGSGS